MRRANVGIVGAAVSALIISGCTSKNAPSSGQSVVPAGSGTLGSGSSPTTVTDVADGISITLPRGYTRLTDDAQIQRIFGTQSANYQHAKIIAVRMPVTQPFAADLDVVVGPAGGTGPSDVDQLLPTASDTLTGEGATIKKHWSPLVAGLPALRIDFTVLANTRTIEGTEVFVIYADKIYLTTMLQDEASYSATDVDDVIESIEFA